MGARQKLANVSRTPWPTRAIPRVLPRELRGIRPQHQRDKELPFKTDENELLDESGRHGNGGTSTLGLEAVPSSEEQITLLSPASALGRLSATLPQAYEQRADVLYAIIHSVRSEAAALLAPALHARAQAMPHATYDEKKELARWVNEELRRFDLAIKCPKTGNPSVLLVGTGHHPEIGRFHLEHKTPEGKRTRSLTSAELPDFELMEANPRREAFLEWRERVRRQPTGAKRG